LTQYRAIQHYVGATLVMAVAGIIWLTHDTLTYEGNDIAQAGILIGILGTVAANILGLLGGMVLGRHFALKEQKEQADASPEG
jgi:hypothetical protein